MDHFIVPKDLLSVIIPHHQSSLEQLVLTQLTKNNSIVQLTD